jgi:hypothetical protein
MASCTCNLLKDHKNDEASPLRFDEALGRFSLQITPDMVIEDAKCLMCGGQDLVANDLQTCECGSVQRWSAVGHIPVHKDPHNGLYMLGGRHTRDGKTIEYAMWYCPVCGGRVNDGVTKSEI